MKDFDKYKLIGKKLDDAIQILQNEISEEYELRTSLYDGTDDSKRHTKPLKKPIILLLHRDNIVKWVEIYCN
ncbi:hypothetical protein VB620_02295 [Nodularia harveyana UHCC-0300]|uniref:Uncharacterized protein n=1 Tax=Nodularia harveyana UHCC-0300 TaxID=2974287 RepID=A0ABU5U9X3_9CYAN|nr:hypothetical protein [Nodularia harveyana]MEA5580168.1 hypothetical protein [Nodularia harveyana UHCC-0300]